MSDTPPERNSNSKSNLIEVQHVGVTAKLQSPLKHAFQTSSSSTETENGQVLFHTHSKTKYDKFSNDTQVEDENTTDTSKILYEMRANAPKRLSKLTPSKIEFQLYNKPTKHLRHSKTTTSATSKSKKKKLKRKLFESKDKSADTSILQRMRQSLDKMRLPKSEKLNSKLFEDFPKTMTNQTAPKSPKDVHFGVYNFEHGCAEYLRTTDSYPNIHSVVIAERATHYATRFWAEFFGSLHICVTFIVTFFLQSYRFLLYSLVNTLLVGMLHMTSDYLIKPILTVIFNGFLQPPLIFIYNILTSIRDILEPVADTLNNFMKPVATVGKSLRLVHATYNTSKTVKEV